MNLVFVTTNRLVYRSKDKAKRCSLMPHEGCLPLSPLKKEHGVEQASANLACANTDQVQEFMS